MSAGCFGRGVEKSGCSCDCKKTAYIEDGIEHCKKCNHLVKTVKKIKSKIMTYQGEAMPNPNMAPYINNR